MGSVLKRFLPGLLFLFFLSSRSLVFAQIPKFTASHFSSENIGLSHNTVLNMTTDDYGFVWISTMDGLNRFDGKSVKVFRHIPIDSTTLSDSFIHGLYVHGSGDFLVGTRDGGLNILNPKTDTITRVNHNTHPNSNIPNAPINVIFEDSKDFLWIGFFTNSIGLMDYVTKDFYPTNLIESGTNNSVHSTNSILELKDGSFILSSLNGIFYISSKEIEKFRDSPRLNNNVKAQRIPFSYDNPSPNTDKIYIDSEGNVWVNIVSDDLRKIDSKMFSEDVRVSIASGVENSSVKKVYLERGDYIIKGQTEGNIKIINKKTEEDQIIKVVDVDEALGASTLFEDTFGNIWFYTWGGGFFRLNESKGIKLFNGDDIPSTFILGFEGDENGTWIATNEGLGFINNDEIFKKVSEQVNNELGSIWSLERDNVGLWVATRSNGLFLIPEPSIKNKNIKFKSFNKGNSLLLNNEVHQVLSDSRGWLWLGYQGEGVQVIKNVEQWVNGEPANVMLLNNNGDENSINSNSIRKIYEDSNGNIWLATTDNGFNYITLSEENISGVQFFQNSGESEFQISHKDGRSVYQQNDSTFWFASYGGGITRWISGSDQLLNLRTTEGLPNNSVYGILGDANQNYIWMSTNNGIARLHTESGSFTNFTEADGLQNNEFNTGAFYKAKNGTLFFGGVNGFNVINSAELSINEIPPKLYLTEVNLFNEKLESDSSILFKKNLQLPYNENFISFEFAALDYDNPSENSYAYKLNGVDFDWVYSGNRNFADYPNLEPGNYTFNVKAANKYGIWNEDGVALNIQVLPPWWKTWWFRLFYTSFLLGALVGLIRYYSQRKLKKELRQMEINNKLRNERERISRDLHDHVGAQLANIITGLTLIDKYSEVDEKEKSVRLMKSLKGDAEVTIKQLRETIWALNQSELKLDGFINHLHSYFKNQSALNEQLLLQINAQEECDVLLTAAQALNLFRIIQEASQNTLKYANAKNLHVSFHISKGSLEICIKDDGTFKGDSESFNGGYGMNNIRKRAEEIMGKLEVTTEEGTEVKVIIPL